MKKVFCLMLALCLTLLCGCGSGPEPTEEPTQGETTGVPTTEAPTEEPTQVPTTEAPTEPLEPLNPLTGEVLDAPHTSRIFAVSINNVPAALPHYGVSKADLFFEMFVNDYCVRGLALYADVAQVEAIGSVRSLRYNFTDICQAYDAVVVHASGSDVVLQDLYNSGVPNVSAENEGSGYFFRDQGRLNAGFAWEHCLFVKGQELKDYTQRKGVSVEKPQGTTYGLSFAEDATPAGGEDASKIVIDFKHGIITKNTTMVYDPETGLYVYHQYGKKMVDGYYDEPESFKNVIVLSTNVYDDYVYHVAELTGEGDGYFACNGKLIPIRWSRAGDNDVFHFTLVDGTPLNLGIGSSYIAIAPLTSSISWE